MGSANAYQVSLIWSEFQHKVEKVSDGMLNKRIYLTAYDGDLYFQNFDNNNGRELWKLEGNSIELAIDINPGPGWSSPANLFVHDGELYFSADNGVDGQELWKWDGVNANMLADINPGPGSSFPNNFVHHEGDIFFVADDGQSGLELWKWDGANASLVADIRPGEETSFVRWFASYAGALYFYAYDGSTAIDFWRYDGISVTAGIEPGPPVPADILQGWIQHKAIYGGALYFAGNQSATCKGLCRFDGNTVTMNANPEWVEGSVGGLVVSGGKLYFRARTNALGSELWQYDGNTVSLVGEIMPGQMGSGPGKFESHGGGLYLSAVKDGLGRELYRGLSLIKDFNPGPDGGNPIDLTTFGDWLYFTVRLTSDGDRELWRLRPDGRMLSIYAELELPYDRWWDFPIRHREVDKSAGTLGFIILDNESGPRLLMRQSVDLVDVHDSDVIYQANKINPKNLAQDMAFVTVIFHDSSDRIAASHIDFRSLDGEPSAKSKNKLKKKTDAFLKKLNTRDLNEMKIWKYSREGELN